jgi:U3 small nucleolar RNA-associated protein 4
MRKVQPSLWNLRSLWSFSLTTNNPRKSLLHHPTLLPWIEPATQEPDASTVMEVDTVVATLVSKPPPTLDVHVHRMRHLQYRPQGILCMKASPRGDLIAVSKEHGSVELRGVTHKFATFARMAGSRRRPVTVLAWTCQDRVWGGSPDGTLCLVDFGRERFASVTESGGGGVFALESLCGKGPCPAKCPGLLVAGCEDGTTRIFRTRSNSSSSSSADEEPVLEMVSLIPTAGAPVLSLAARTIPTPTGGLHTVVFAGVADATIRRYDCSEPLGMPSSNSNNNNKRVWKSTLRMTVETLGRTTPTRVWSLQVLSDGTLVSTDSLGHVQIWDGDTGTLQQSFDHNEYKADVLCCVCNRSETKLFASGVDSRVVCIERAPLQPSTSSEPRQWTLTHAQRPHSHDVKAMAIGMLDAQSDLEILCTGGVDTKLCTYSVKTFKSGRPRTLHPWPVHAPMALAASGRLLAMIREDRCDLYRLARPHTNILAPIPIADEGHTLVATMRIKGNQSRNFKCLAINNAGTYVAFSDDVDLYVFCIGLSKDGSMYCTRMRTSPYVVYAGISMLKFATNNKLVIATTDGVIRTMVLPKKQINTKDPIKSVSEVTLTVDESIARYSLYPVHSMDCTPNGAWCVVCRTGQNSISQIDVLSQKERGQYTLWWTIVTTEKPVASVALISGDVIKLAVAYSHFGLSIYNVQLKTLDPWSSTSNDFPTDLTQRNDFPVRVCVHPSTPSKVIVVRFHTRMGIFICLYNCKDLLRLVFCVNGRVDVLLATATIRHRSLGAAPRGSSDIVLDDTLFCFSPCMIFCLLRARLVRLQSMTLLNGDPPNRDGFPNNTYGVANVDDRRR